MLDLGFINRFWLCWIVFNEQQRVREERSHKQVEDFSLYLG